MTETSRRWLRWGAAGFGALIAVVLALLLARRGSKPESVPVAAEYHAPPPPGATAPKPKKPRPAEAFFGIDRIHQFDVTMSAVEWAELQTSVGRGARGGSELESDFVDSDGRLVHRGGGFGGIFPWVHGQVTQTNGPKTDLPDVGIRYKGNASFTGSEGMLRRNLKVKTDLYGSDIEFEGMKTLNFNSGALDPSRIRESLSFAIFRAAGVPAPRTTFAEVSITVPGHYDRELAGIYTVVEQINKTFLKYAVPPGDGLLMKPERAGGGIAYLGENWAAYDSIYRPEREPTPEESHRVIEFARLIDRSPDDQFARQVGSYLDVDEFLRYIAVNALLSNMDSYLSGRHNYCLYLDPTTNRLLFLPWDMDLSLGGLSRGSVNASFELSLEHPYTGQNSLISRLLKVPEIHAQYFAILKEIVASTFNQAGLKKLVSTIQSTTADAHDREDEAARNRTEFLRAGRGPAVSTFLTERLRSVTDQLAGKSKGIEPAGGGPGGGFGRGFPGGRGP